MSIKKAAIPAELSLKPIKLKIARVTTISEKAARMNPQAASLTITWNNPPPSGTYEIYPVLKMKDGLATTSGNGTFITIK